MKDYSKFIDNNLIYVSLYHDISILKTNYRNIFVDRVYKDNKYIDNFKIVEYNMDRIMKFWYDKDVKNIIKSDLLNKT